jgi:hypothetical protein
MCVPCHVHRVGSSAREEVVGERYVWMGLRHANSHSLNAEKEIKMWQYMNERSDTSKSEASVFPTWRLVAGAGAPAPRLASGVAFARSLSQAQARTEHRIAMLLIFATIHVLAAIRKGDLLALQSLFRLLGGSNWTHNENWDPEGGSDPCKVRWRGVGCSDPCDPFLDQHGDDDEQHCALGRVLSINLRENNVRGNLSEWTELGNLHNLTLLDLSVNNVSGFLPTELGMVRDLETLNLEWNQLEGGFNDNALATLNSGGDKRFSLDTISIEHNNVSGTLPSELGLHTRLAMVNLQYNRLSGVIPQTLSSLGEAQVIMLNDNRLSGTLPTALGNAASLRYLNASWNSLSGTLPPSLGNLTALRDLTLAHNHISGSLPNELGLATQLKRLWLNDNQLTGNLTAFENLGELEFLDTLDLYNNRMDESEIHSSVQFLDQLKYLYVDHRHLRPLRQGYCRERFPMSMHGKYNFRVVRERYAWLTESKCEGMYSTEFAFKPLQESGAYAP